MLTLAGVETWVERETLVEAFEAARASDQHVLLAAFIPAAEHPLRTSVLVELVRIDLEQAWQAGRAPRLDDYLSQYPELADDDQAREQLAYEDFRQLQRLGQDPRPERYAERFRIDTAHWPNVASEVDFPEPGDVLAGFQLLGDLGQGALARVYLARQAELAERLVVLKVARASRTEPQALAQLQHTNVMPIHSWHQTAGFDIVCMPFLGTVTLADVLRQLRHSAAEAQRPFPPASGADLFSTLQSQPSMRLPAWSDPLNRDETPPPRLTAAAAAAAKGSYVAAVLWVAKGLAEGLAHAHERGILHLDLKPANALLADNGMPLLLDFNLSADVKDHSLDALRLTGGTLAYMAPEHLADLLAGRRSTDPRGDLFSLGVILYEFLTGQRPFPTTPGESLAALKQTLANRSQPLANLPGPLERPFHGRWPHGQLTPAVASILGRCLEPDPARRYQSAAELAEDLSRQLAHQPLAHAPETSLWERTGKWARRHPRLSSAGTLGLVATACLALLAGSLTIQARRARRFEAAENFQQFSAAVRPATYALNNALSVDPRQMELGLLLGRQALADYSVLSDVTWQNLPGVRNLSPADQVALRGEAGQLLVLMGQAAAALAQFDPDTRAVRLAEAAAYVEHARTCLDEPARFLALGQLQALVADPAGSGNWAALNSSDPDSPPAPPTEGQGSLDSYFLGRQLALAGRWREAIEHLRTAVARDPQSFWAWFVLGRCHDELAQYRDAQEAYSLCIALRPEFAPSYYNRGLTHLHRRNAASARQDFDQALRLDAALVEAWINRALARLAQKDPAGADADLTQALTLRPADARILLARARVRVALDPAAAEADRQAGLAATPQDALTFVARGVARLPADRLGALADFEQALTLNPRYLPALQNTAAMLAEDRARWGEAIAALDEACRWYPDFIPARSGRAVLHARAGDRPRAIADAQWSLGQEDSPELRYQIACVYALTSTVEPADTERALRLLGQALRAGYGWELLASDSDLDPLRANAEFARLLSEAAALDQTAPHNEPSK